MNKSILETDSELKRLLQQSTTEVPEAVAARIGETLGSLSRKRKRPRKYMAGVLGASILLGGMALSSYAVPGLAHALSKIPVVGSLFEYMGETGLRLSGSLGLSTTLNETAEDQGISMTITEVLYDGVQLSVGYIIESNEDIRPHWADLYADGRVFAASSSLNVNRLDGQYVGGIITYEPNEPLPDRFQLKLHFKSMENWTAWNTKPEEIEGSWAFHVVVEKITEGMVVKTFDDPPTVQYGELSLSVSRVILTPVSTILEMQTLEPADYESLSFQVKDQDGIAVQNKTSRAQSHGSPHDKYTLRNRRVIFAPFERVPESIEITPYKDNWPDLIISRKIVFDGEEFPFAIDQGEAGKLTVTDIQYLPDKTLVHYYVEGQDPYGQADTISLEGVSRRYISQLSPIHVRDAGHPYTFMKVFPAMKPGEASSFIVSEMNAPLFMKELAIRIPIK